MNLRSGKYFYPQIFT